MGVGPRRGPRGQRGPSEARQLLLAGGGGPLCGPEGPPGCESRGGGHPGGLGLPSLRAAVVAERGDGALAAQPAPRGSSNDFAGFGGGLLLQLLPLQLLGCGRAGGAGLRRSPRGLLRLDGLRGAAALALGAAFKSLARPVVQREVAQRRAGHLQQRQSPVVSPVIHEAGQTDS